MQKKNKIRVVHLIASNFVGGPEKQILRHARDAAARGIDIWVSSFRDNNARAEILSKADAQGTPTFEISSSGWFDPRAIFQLRSFLRRQKIDILCTHGYKANTIGVLTRWHAKIPQAAFLRGWTAETPRVRAYEALERLLLPFASCVVCVSEAQAHQLRQVRRYAAGVTVIQNACLFDDVLQEESRAAAKQALGIGPEILLVGTAGRLSIEKGHRYLIQAAAEICNRMGNVKVVILGEGRERGRLETLAQECGLQNQVAFPGFQTDVDRWLRAMDVFVLPSLTEGLPNVILEALSLGTPIVATAVGGVPDLLKRGDAGLLVPPEDASALSQSILTLLEDRELATALAEKGGTWVRTEFSPSHQCDQMLTLYSSLLGASQTQQSVADEPSLSTLTVDDAFVPFISVVIPVRNEEKHIGGILQELLDQDYPTHSFEILVADGASTDRTFVIAEEFARTFDTKVVCLRNPDQLSSAGRNVGVRSSRGELILFIDGHCKLLNRALLRNYARVMQETGADCLCRAQPLDAPDISWFQQVIGHARASSLGHGLDSTIYSIHLTGPVDPTSSGAAYRRSLFERIGMYDQHFDACEDVDFNYRVHKSGARSYIDPRLVVHYYPRSSLGRLWKQLVRYGRGRFRLIRKHPEVLSVGQLIPPAMIAWFALGGIVSFFSPLVAKVLFASLALYLGLVLAFSIALGLRYGWRHLVMLPAVYLTIHFALGAGFWLEASDAVRRQESVPRRVVPHDKAGQRVGPSLEATPSQGERKADGSKVQTTGIQG